MTRIPNTPGYFSAQTPAVFNSFDDGTRFPSKTCVGPYSLSAPELPDEWIVKYKDKLIGNRAIVKLPNGSGYEEGLMDRSEFVLLDVTVPREDLEAEASATVVLWENGAQTGNPHTIPVRYLKPVPPDQLGHTVVIFMGPLAGKQGIVRSIESDTECVVQIFEDQVLEDISKDYMTLCAADHLQ